MNLKQYFTDSIRNKGVAAFLLPLLLLILFVSIYYPAKQKSVSLESVQTQAVTLINMLAFTVGSGFEQGNYELVNIAFDWVKSDKNVIYIALIGDKMETLVEHNPAHLKISPSEITKFEFDESSNCYKNSVPINYNGKYYGRIILVYSFERVASAVRTAVITSAIVGFVILLIGGVLILLIFEKISSGLIGLRDAAKLASDGNLEVMIKNRSKDEVGMLTETFNKMIGNIAKANSQLENVNHELESFSYSVSHDLKAPLRGIDGYSRLLLEDHFTQLDDEGKYFVTTIRNAAIQMGQLIDDLLSYSRLERKPMVNHKIDLFPFISKFLSVYEEKVNNGEIVLLDSSRKIYVNADTDGLGIGIRNLIENAVKFSGKTTSPKIEIGVNERENCYIIFVKDNGIGFDMQYHNRIFEIFQRLHRIEEYPGTGIGLAIVKKAMTRMGGDVWAESKINEGSTFYLEIKK